MCCYYQVIFLLKKLCEEIREKWEKYKIMVLGSSLKSDFHPPKKVALIASMKAL